MRALIMLTGFVGLLPAFATAQVCRVEADGQAVERAAFTGDLWLNRAICADPAETNRISAILEQIECEAIETLVALDVGRMTRAADLNPQLDLPDLWGVSPQRYDRGVRDAVRRIADAVDEAGDFEAQRAQLRQLVAQPEARVAMAELIGLDRYFRMGGAHRAERFFAPDRLARYQGPEAEVDPHGPEAVAGMDAELEALEKVAERVQSEDWSATRDRVAALGPVAYLQHVRVILGATTAVELKAAHDALREDLLGVGE